MNNSSKREIKPENLQQPAKDLKYLLDNDYNLESSLDFIVQNHQLNKKEKNFLRRYVFSEDDINEHYSKLTSIDSISGQNLVIDGYNALITVESILERRLTLECMDGILRDFSMTFSNYKFNRRTKQALGEILCLLRRYEPNHILFIYDSQISKSGELAAYTRESLEVEGLDGNAQTNPQADNKIINLAKTTVTTDSAIIKEVRSILDLGKEIKKKH